MTGFNYFTYCTVMMNIYLIHVRQRDLPLILSSIFRDTVYGNVRGGMIHGLTSALVKFRLLLLLLLIRLII